MMIGFKDERTLSGTPLQIVQGMKSLSLFASGQSIHEYVREVIRAAEEHEGVRMWVSDEDPGADASLAEGLVKEMERTGLITVLSR